VVRYNTRMAHLRYVAVCIFYWLHVAITASAAAAPHLLAALQADPELTTLSAMVQKGGMAAGLQDASLQVW
jgi:hypothetical protein